MGYSTNLREKKGITFIRNKMPFCIYDGTGAPWQVFLSLLSAFLPMRMHYSWVWRKRSVPLGHVSVPGTKKVPEEDKVSYPEIQGPCFLLIGYSTLWSFGHCSHAALSLHISNQIFLAGYYKVQQHIGSSTTCTKELLLMLSKYLLDCLCLQASSCRLLKLFNQYGWSALFSRDPETCYWKREE